MILHPYHKTRSGLRVLAFLVIFFSFFASESCKPKYRQQDMPAGSYLPDQEFSYRSNQLLIKQSAKSIRDLAADKGWSLTETGTGVFYRIYKSVKKSHTGNIEPGDWVSLFYTLTLLDGTKCYSSEDQGPKQFVVEKSEAESGLHEAVQFLHDGDSALVIIPSHRAFGLSGDGNRIPPKAILVYEIRVDSVVRHVNN